MTVNGLTISQAAKKAGVKVSTIRYYERRKLLTEPPRRASGSSFHHNGYRMFGDADVARIRFIQNAQGLGFTLEEIQALLDLRVDTDTTCADVRARALAKIDDIDAKLRELKRIRKALIQLADECTGRGPAHDCPILEHLQNESE